MQLPSPTAQAPQAAPTAGTSPADCALCRRPPPLGCRGGGGGEVRHELTVWVRPAGSLGQSSGALLTQPPACTCPCPTVHLLAPGPASCRAPGRRPGSPSYLSLHLRTPAPPLPAEGAQQQPLLTAARWGRGPLQPWPMAERDRQRPLTDSCSSRGGGGGGPGGAARGWATVRGPVAAIAR